MLMAATTGLTFAIGDIHGRADLLQRLQASIKETAARVGGNGHKVVYLGDYVDRGPGSRQVLDLVLGGLPDFARVTLSGNHEDMMASYLHAPDPSSAWNWHRNGGEATLASYGIQVSLADFARDYAVVRDRLLAVLPGAHRHALLGGGLDLMHQDEQAIFVHAGLNPEFSLEEQQASDMLWIREPFLDSTRDWGKTVVHGHTPSEWGAVVRPNRINVDTGAYATGDLTAVVLCAGMAPRFLVASAPLPWQLVFDPEGDGTPAWLDWVLAKASGSGARYVGVCMPDALAVQAEEACSAVGVGFKRVDLDSVATALANPSSPLALARLSGRVGMNHSGPAARNCMEDAFSLARSIGRPAS
jgi:serine/threonine protein phosphatase 1